MRKQMGVVLLILFTVLSFYAFSYSVYAEEPTRNTYVYNPEDMDSAKRVYEYFCSYTNALGEKEYLFFNASDVGVRYHSGNYYGYYDVDGTMLSIAVSGDCLFIGTRSGALFTDVMDDFEVFTDFAIQKGDNNGKKY